MVGPAPFAPSGFFVLRAPLLPFSALATDPAGGDAGSSASCDERLGRLLARPDVREAVFLASPSLDAAIEGWRRDPCSEAGRRVAATLTRYAARMAGRATPFGLFAGCAVGAVGRSTRLRVGSSLRRHTRLDMDYVVSLAEALARDPALRPALRFTPNTSLCRVAGRARYREARRSDEGWTHRRVVLEVPDYLDAVLHRAEGGATPGDLATALLRHDPEATEAEAAEYVDELIEQQVLVSELTPAVTGPEAVHGLIERLAGRPGGRPAAAALAAVRDEFAAMDAEGPGAPPDRYRAIAERLATLPAPVDASRLFQVDLVREGAGATLGENVVAEIARGVRLLWRLAPSRADDPLAAFRRAFRDRFGDTPVTREVPLAEALDPETGVEFGGDAVRIEASSLLEDLDLSPSVPGPVPWTPREAHLLARLTEALARGDTEIALGERDVERLSAGDPDPLPDAFATLARLEAASEEAVARGDFRLFLAGTVGPSGARLLGRFCHADADLAARVEEHLRAEEALRPDLAFAEIVHLPEGRLGNILARPACRAHEIPYLGRSSLAPGRRLPLDDLRVSVAGDRVVLRSARLGREVAPRLTCAHDTGRSQGVYRFLCALQEQGVAGRLAWDWGPLAGSAFLPRVVSGRLVLARARWLATSEETTEILSGAEGDRLARLARWRDARRLPRWVCLVEGDNELPVDLEDAGMAAMLLGRLRRGRPATLVELLPGPDRLCAAGPDGRFVHEIVVPFVRQAPAPAAKAAEGRGDARIPVASSRHRARDRRVFPPGSEWMSVKLYAGPSVIDRFLGDVLGPLASRWTAQGRVDGWFFVRYADPHGHLRVRFAGGAVRLRADVLPCLESAVAPLVEDGRVWRVALDTYEREVERYGGPAGIEACERIFHHDSVATAEIVRRLADDRRGDLRWRTAYLGMHRLLDDLDLSPEARRAVLARARDALGRRLGVEPRAFGRIGARYRTESAALAGLLAGEADGDLDRAAARSAFDRRSAGVAPAAAALREAARAGRLTASVPDLAGSLLHMHANRLLRSAQPTQELVLYDFLHRHYDGLCARRAAAARAAGTAS